MSKSYRFDQRSEAEFKKDIKQGHIIEAEIAVRLCIAVHSKTKKWPDLIPNGVDSTGEFIEEKKVNANPDFLIGDRLVEITRSDVICNRTFHQKKHKIERLIKENGDLIYVNGYNIEKQPKFIWLTSDQIKEFTQRSESKYGIVFPPGNRKIKFINKPSYRYDIYWFDEADLWLPLPNLIKSIPDKYKEMLKSTKV